MNDSLSQQKEKSKEKYNFERSLLKTLPKCIELNLIAKEFKKNVSMSVKMMLANEEDEEDDLEMKKRTILIKVINREAGYSYWWDTETLSNRYYIIKDMSEQYFETGVVPALTDATDPFWDPQTPTLIGRGFLTTKALAYMFDNPASLPIIGEDEHCGELIVNLVPTDDTGTRNLCEEMDEEEVEFEPEELIDKPLHYLIVVTSARIPTNYKDIFVEYQIRTNEHERQKFRTDTVTPPPRRSRNAPTSPASTTPSSTSSTGSPPPSSTSSPPPRYLPPHPDHLQGLRLRSRRGREEDAQAPQDAGTSRARRREGQEGGPQEAAEDLHDAARAAASPDARHQAPRRGGEEGDQAGRRGHGEEQRVGHQQYSGRTQPEERQGEGLRDLLSDSITWISGSEGKGRQKRRRSIEAGSR